MDGKPALIGAPFDDRNGPSSGAAFVFDFDGTTWTETATLTVTDGAPGDQFGFAVSLDGGRPLLGATYDDDNGRDPGSAFVFDFEDLVSPPDAF